MTGLPPELRARPALALTRAVETIPGPSDLRGGCQYEPKWDGFRVAIVRDETTTTAWSRRGADLSAVFPDLVAAATQQVLPGYVLDGEAVIWDGDRTSFAALQQRTTTRGPALRHLARSRPASFVCFDVLALGGHDLRDQPLRERRNLLEAFAREWAPPLTLAPATTDLEQAKAWFTDFTEAGLEGLVVKGLGVPYPAGRREWLKVKHRATLDVVCAAVVGPVGRPRALVVGLPSAAGLEIVGRTGVLSARVSAQVGALLPAYDSSAGPHPWPDQVPPSWFDRYSPDKTPVVLTHVEPTVVEV